MPAQRLSPPPGAFSIPKENLAGFDLVEVLCEVDIPRIFTVRVGGWMLFLAYLADEHEGGKTLLLAPVSDAAIEAIKDGKTPLRDALLGSWLWMVEQDWNDQIIACHQVQPSDIGPRYLPRPGTTLCLEHMPVLTARSVGGYSGAMSDTNHPPGKPLLFEIDGPDVHPHTIGAAESLDLAASYFLLVEALSKDMSSTPIRFVGLEILDKCTAFATRPEVEAVDRDMIAAAEVWAQVLEFIGMANLCVADAQPAPSGAKNLVDRFRAASRRLPAEQKIVVVHDAWRAEVPRTIEPPVAFWETTALRVKPIRVGGTIPTARFSSPSEDAPFTLRLRNEEQARKLAAYLYLEIDAELRVRRDRDGKIEQGHLESFSSLADGDPIAAWRDWFGKNAAKWNAVVDLDAELRGEESDDDAA